MLEEEISAETQHVPGGIQLSTVQMGNDVYVQTGPQGHMNRKSILWETRHSNLKQLFRGLRKQRGRNMDLYRGFLTGKEQQSISVVW